MRLADIKGDKAFEVLADLLTPVTNLCADEEFVEAINRTYIEGMQVALKKHPDDKAAMKEAMELEEFFHSSWYGVLTQVDPDYLIDRLRKETVK